jgi:lipopolysaccharide/colanic/teichoic acid biosynthesis glycosyltransferase
MRAAPAAYSSGRIWNRLRVQLGGALLFGVALPLIAMRFYLPDPSLDTFLDQNLAGLVLASSLSVYLLRNITLYPGIKSGYFVLPAVLIAYGIVFALYLFLRIDYSRAPLLGSLGCNLVWLYLSTFLSARAGIARFAVIPFGSGKSLLDVPTINWTALKAPNLGQERYDALVADFQHDLPDEWEAFLAECALRGIPVFHVKQLREALTGRVEIEHLSENSFGSLIPFMAYLRLRRLIDFVTALVAGLILLLPLLLVALIIRLESPGPALFRQRRMGYRGAPFIVTKFRTMRHDRAEDDARTGAITREGDERITRIGAFLRRTRIDELPQILNVLKGEMSWIGPRPEAEPLSHWYESELPFYRYRHIVPPGITGWAQVNQGHVSGLEDVNLKLQYDFYYVKNFSPWLDALIVARTVQTVLTGFGSR